MQTQKLFELSVEIYKQNVEPFKMKVGLIGHTLRKPESPAHSDLEPKKAKNEKMA